MRTLLAVVLVALATAAGASADSQPGSDTLTPASTPTPNIVGVLLPQLLVPPAQPQQLSYDQLLPIWQAAGQQYGIPWPVLAAINKVESNFGQNMGPSSAGAIGWMQFMPDTWARWGYDADGNGVADPWNATDAIFSAARYLAAAGGTADLRGAIFAYNHADWYVDEVLALAQQLDAGGADFAAQLQVAQETLQQAQQAVADATAKLNDAKQRLADLQQREAVFVQKADDASNLSDRLDQQKAAALVDVDVQSTQAEVDADQAALDTAQSQLDAAQSSAAPTTFASGVGAGLTAGPVSTDGYVFPVGGGAGIVTVGHTHHDYPAANIDAPAGSPEYALHDGAVDNAWDASVGGKCGTGFTISTTDGLVWTYCHMASLDPAVFAGAQLTAGQAVGLVGQTGDATGPNLHLQLQPATGYPQDEQWFQSFAGTAFSWSDDVQHNAAPDPVFAVVGSGGDGGRGLDSASLPVVYFSTGS